MKNQYQYTVFFEPQKGGFNVNVPAIPEIATFGNSLAEAQRMAEEAIRLYLESALERGEDIPEDVEPTRATVAVAL